MKSEDLFKSLKEILKFNKIVPDYSRMPFASLKSKEERQKFRNWKSKVDLREPQLLVGKSIQHHLKDEGETCWCRGEVIGIEKSLKKQKRTW